MFEAVSKRQFLDQLLLMSEPAAALQALWKSGWRNDIPAWDGAWTRQPLKGPFQPIPFQTPASKGDTETVKEEDADFQTCCEFFALLMLT